MPANFTGSLAISGSLIISGSILTSGSITISGSIASASYAQFLGGLPSSSFASASVFNQVSSSYSSASGSLSTRVTNLESTSSTVSSSFASTSGSIAGRVNIIETSYATTGSNNFNGNQTITGSLNVTQNITGSNILSTGTITAQTLVVQTVTSSIVYSSGSNIFGNQLTNVQQITGSLRVTGSGNHYILGGNVGIGNASPNDKLEVNGAIFTTANTVLATTKGAIFDFNDGQDAGRMLAYKSTGANLLFYTNANGGALTERMRINASGSVGIGVTPSAWSTSTPALQVAGYGSISTTGGIDTQISNNAYYDGTNWRYIASQEAANYYMNRDTHVWRYRTAGTAGAIITWNEAMRITNAGLVGINTTTPSYLLDVRGTTPTIQVKATGSSGATFSALYLSSPQVTWNILNDDNGGGGDLRFYNDVLVADALRIKKASNTVGIGTTNIGTEANLSLGAFSANEGGQLILQKATSFASASHLDNYQNRFRIMSGTDTTSVAERFSIDMTNAEVNIMGGALYSSTTLISIPNTATTIFTSTGTGGVWLVSYAVSGNPAQVGYAIVGNAFGSTLTLLASTAGSQTALSVSGLNLQLSQSAGGSINTRVNVIKLATTYG